ncbi:MAG: malate dehydrogenase [Gammaproteobacteria bacterium]|jgi:malate dehydrogenase
MDKIAVIGSGRVGEATTLFLAQQNLAKEVVLLDVKGDYAAGTALDVAETAPIFRFDTRIIGSGDMSIMHDAQMVIVTAGFPRKPGMSRSDVLQSNVQIIDSVVENVVKYAPNSMILVVSNPVDIITYRAFKKAGFPRNRVFGQAGVLDSARMATFIALETGYSAKDISAMVLGGHGDSMVPMIRYTTINGISVDKFLNKDQTDAIINRTRNGGAEVLKLKEISSAYQAPGASTVEMVDAIVHNRKRILPTVCILDGEYQQKDIAMGVPAVLGKNGVEKVVELELNADEQKMFTASVNSVRQDIDLLATL